MKDDPILTEEFDRLRSEAARIPRLLRRIRWLRFCLLLGGVLAFPSMWMVRIYWEAEGTREVCPAIPAAPVEAPAKFCRDSAIELRREGETACPHTDHRGQYLYRSAGADLLLCFCQRGTGKDAGQ